MKERMYDKIKFGDRASLSQGSRILTQQEE